MEPYSEQYRQPIKSVKELNPEELQHLFNKLSSDEMKEVQDVLRNCSTEMSLTRAAPFTALVLGTLYFARTRLPSQYHFGPKGWPFYAALGTMSFFGSSIYFSSRTCRERVLPKIGEYWNKYQGQETKKMTYDYIRQQHRSGNAIPERAPLETTYEGLRKEHRGQTTQSDNFIYDMPQRDSFSSYGQTTEENSIPPRRNFNYNQFPESESFMSGTPAGPSKQKDFS